MDLWVSAANTRRRREGGWSRKPTRKNWQLARLLNRPPEKPWAHLRGYTSEAKALNSERTNAGKPPKMRRVLCLQCFEQFGADASNSCKTPIDGQQECGRLAFLLLTV